MNRRFRADDMESFQNTTSFARDLWIQASSPVNHRFDKLGNPLPLELYGCGCGLCARQQRAALKSGSSRTQGEASEFVGNFWEA
jgi:hypothetical protein